MPITGSELYGIYAAARGWNRGLVIIDAAGITSLEDDDTPAFLVALVIASTAVPAPPEASTAPAVDYVPPELVSMAGVGQRFSRIRWELVDALGHYLGELTPDADQSVPNIVVNTEAPLKRSLQGLSLSPADAAAIDVFADRVHPVWVMSDGTEYSLGFYVFADASRPLRSWGTGMVSSMVDDLLRLDQAVGAAEGLPAGTLIADGLAAQWAATGLTAFTVDPSGAVVAEPIAWPPETTRLDRLVTLSRLGAYLDPYIDNEGVGRSRLVPDLTVTTSTLVYDDSAERSRVDAESVVITDDLLDAPNRFLVVSSSATDAPLVATADVPASAPHSFQRRGFYVVRTLRVQGIETVDQAQAMANAEMARSLQTLTYVEFDAAPDPRHDIFDVVRWLGDNYLELGWTLKLQEGSQHHHRLRKSEPLHG